MSNGMKIALTIVGAPVSIVLVGGLGVYSYINNLRNDMVGYESQLNAQYLSNQNYLSSYISGFYEQMGITKFKSDKLDTILADYAKGRSGGNGKEDKQSFINAVHEAVPNLDGLNIADKMMDYVSAGRAGETYMNFIKR
jgi:hypothetical protein